MAKKKLFKAKTNFTLKRMHQSGSYGNIYERDYTTIANTSAVPEGQIPIYSSPSFKLSVRAGYNGQKKYNYGNWTSNPQVKVSVGDVAYWDGDKVRTIALNKWDTGLGTPIGVVVMSCSATDDNFRIISLKRTEGGTGEGCPWCSSSETNSLNCITDYESSEKAKEDFNGLTNTECMISVLTNTYTTINGVNYNYAFESVKQFSDGVTSGVNKPKWYIPSAGELVNMYSNIALIETTLEKIGGDALYFWMPSNSSRIWSSTEKDSKTVYWLNNGVLEPADKVQRWGYVRPFASIKCSSITWTLDCMPEPNKQDSQIVLKPNAHRLTDFACYGSSTELIRASLTDIISRFPAELYVTDNTYTTGEYIVDNPMAIDIIQGAVPENSTFSSLRYMCESFTKYETNDQPITDWVVASKQASGCLENGDLIATVTLAPFGVIKCYYHEDKIIYTTSVSPGAYIRPNKAAIDEFFNSLDDFEKVLLNQYTEYTATFETYVEDEQDGWYMVERKYQWPLAKGGWNLAINGKNYTDYINSLSDLASNYDQLYTDAIWRSMTHEAISNMDLTLTRNEDDIEIPNSSKLKQALSVVGRQFDDIKKYADNIKTSNSISYSQDNNTPDYFLPDNLENSGWEPKVLFSEVSDNIVTDPMYGSRTIGYTAGDASAEFMRRLKINSKHIFAKKGTKQGIEDLMAVFGYHSVDWIKRYRDYNDIYEHPDGNLDSNIYRKSFLMIEQVYIADSYAYDIDGEEMRDKVLELNQLKDSFSNEDMLNDNVDLNYYQGLPVAEVTIGDKTQLVPWFDKDESYDGNIYFQMKGGWSRNDGDKTLTPAPESVYEKTVSKIRYVETLDDLTDLSYNVIDEHNIYYVGQEKEYYKLKNILEHDDITNGWTKASEKEISEAENIIDNNKGNNPHTGNYDDGISYLEAMGTLFKNASFDNAREESIENRYQYGFNTVKQADSTKCLFFGINAGISTVALRGENRIKPVDIFAEKSDTDDNVSYSEAASLSVINSKELHIVFDFAHKNFLEENVIPYVKQMIPSTTIFSYSFDELGDDFNTKYDVRTHQVICDGKICPIYGVA